MLHTSDNYGTYKAGRNQRNHAQDKEYNAHNSLRYRKRHSQEFWMKIMTVVLLLQQTNETDKSDDVVSPFAANAKKIHKQRIA
jgi:hypothetical protein